MSALTVSYPLVDTHNYYNTRLLVLAHTCKKHEFILSKSKSDLNNNNFYFDL